MIIQRCTRVTHRQLRYPQSLLLVCLWVKISLVHIIRQDRANSDELRAGSTRHSQEQQDEHDSCAGLAEKGGGGGGGGESSRDIRGGKSTHRRVPSKGDSSKTECCSERLENCLALEQGNRGGRLTKGIENQAKPPIRNAFTVVVPLEATARW